jgi:hypothetical protein
MHSIRRHSLLREAATAPDNGQPGNLEPVEDARDRALALAKGLPATPANLQRVARATGDDVARWAFGQWELRTRAKTKFARAEEMGFVREALEQATHERVAAYHASLFPPDVLVADLTSGIGADLIALAARGPAIGFELDPDRAEYARQNLRVHGHASEVKVEDSLLAGWTFAYAFADPARRVEGRRTLDPEEFSPNPVVLAERFQALQRGVIKLSPLLHDSFLESLGPWLQFVSFGGECREALVAVGQSVAGSRTAHHVESGETVEAMAPPEPVLEPGEYLYEADPAAIRAHAVGTLSSRYGLKPLGDSNGYLTGHEPIDSPWLRVYRVLYHGKADTRATKAALRQHEAATPELKQRGAGLDLVKLRKEFASSGSRPVSLAIWPVGRSLRHTILDRLDIKRLP